MTDFVENDGKAELMRDMADGWTKLNAFLDGLTPDQAARLVDDAGWTVKDHITHMTAWERSIAFFLQGQPRNSGLGVDRELYAAGDLDRLNDVVRQQAAQLSMEEARAEAQAVHHQILQLLDGMTDADLQKPNREFAPSVTGQYDDLAVIINIRSNTAEHYVEHLEWLETLVSKG